MGGLPSLHACSSDERDRTRARFPRRWGDTRGRRFFWWNRGVSHFEIQFVEILPTKTEFVAQVEPLRLSRFSNPSALARVPPLERILYPLGLRRQRVRQFIACATASAVLAIFRVSQHGRCRESLEGVYLGRPRSRHALLCEPSCLPKLPVVAALRIRGTSRQDRARTKEGVA